jgi:tRNA threonylcarbamoyladenosine biosynthesis protein TsaB
MRVLAIDTALAACAAAVLDTAYGGIIASESLPMIRGHAEALIPLVARVIQQSEMKFHDLDRVAVTTGPGSFTGLRVGLAAARGFGVATGLPVVGVSTLSVYAAPYLAATDNRFPVVAAIDARHQHVYLQVFDPAGRTVIAPRLAPLREAIRAASEAPSCLVGSAAQAVADALANSAPAPPAVDSRDAPDIAWVARIGAVAPEEKSPPNPLYLRAPDTQPQNAAQLPRR